LQFGDPVAEAVGVAHLVRDARLPGGRWRSIAVLARTNEQLERIAMALDRQGVPHRRRGPAARDPAMTAALGELRSVTGPGTLQAWLDEGVAASASDADPDDYAADDYAEDGGRSRAEMPPALLRAAQDLLAQDPAADGPALRAYLSTGGARGGAAGDEPDDEDADGVTLVTFHAAKGLEWPTVVVVGVVPGLVPHAAARQEAALAEERRLFHVAITRAEHDLALTWYGDELSPFLSSSLPTVPLAAEPVVPPPEAWRRDAARAARVDEVVLLDDDTLATVASRRPASVEELAAVPGVGRLMASRHGERLLAVLAAATSPDEVAASPPDLRPARSSRPRSGP
jgi:DNA helicase-2/ATP-dependent DNA helicase PcrA